MTKGAKKKKYEVAGWGFSHKGAIFKWCFRMMSRYRSRQEMSERDVAFMLDLLTHYPRRDELEGEPGVKTVRVDNALKRFVVVRNDGSEQVFNHAEAIKGLPQRERN